MTAIELERKKETARIVGKILTKISLFGIAIFFLRDDGMSWHSILAIWLLAGLRRSL